MGSCVGPAVMSMRTGTGAQAGGDRRFIGATYWSEAYAPTRPGAGGSGSGGRYFQF